MAELETSDWKDNRRFRLLTLHHGVLNFADYHFHSDSFQPGSASISVRRQPGQGFTVAAQEPSAAAGEAMG